MAETKLVTLKINDRDVQVPTGTLVIEATRRIGTEVPSFCYYPQLSLAGRLPDVPRGSRKNAEAADGVHAGGDRRHGRANEHGSSTRRAEGDAGISADESSAGLPGVRQGRRVRAAGHGVPLRRGYEPVRRGKNSPAGRKMVGPGLLRCAAVHSLLPLRARVR